MDGMLVNSGEFSGLSCEEAIEKMSALAEEKKFGKATVTFRLKDWGISRQRYWGTPIPMVYCEKDGVVPVAEKDLPVILPDKVNDHADRRVAADECAGVSAIRLVRSVAARRGARRTRWIRSSIRRGTSTATPTRTMTRLRSIRNDCLLVSDRSIHWRRGARHSPPYLFALLDEVHARHGSGEERRARRSACSRRGW